MSQRSRSSKRYRERAGLIKTWRGPLPTTAPLRNLIHTAPGLTPPLPLPEQLLITTPGSSPDQGSFTIWPNGADGESAQ